MTESTEKPPWLCWVGTTTFAKDNAPLLGTKGVSARRVVVMDAADFGRLAKLLPTEVFKIGDLDG